MDAFTRDLKLIRLMMREERRLNSAMIGKAQFLLFPVVILVFSLVLALSSEQLFRALPLDQVYTALLAIITLYGLGVGGFALFGERIAQRRFGDVTLMLQTPSIQPISFRTMLLVFYVKDIIYYLVYSIVPIVAGIALSIPITGFHPGSVGFLAVTMTLSFLFGISLSFLLSSIYVRRKALFALLVAAILFSMAVGFTTGWFDVLVLLPPLMLQLTRDPVYALTSIVLIVAFSAVAVLTIRLRFGAPSGHYPEGMMAAARRFSFAKERAPLMGKDWIDLVRSGTIVPVFAAYIGPLAFLAMLFWFLGSVLQLPLSFNLIFYAAMIGFFSVSVYGWLNMLDATAFLDVLPVQVSQLVRSKLLMLSFLATIASTAFLAALAVLQGELGLLPVSLLVAYATTAYTVTATADLTGLRTNSYLFDPLVLGKFAALIVPPLVALTILSFGYSGGPLTYGLALAGVSAALLIAAWLLNRGIGRRWDRASFSF